jgi:hypothetical protein
MTLLKTLQRALTPIGRKMVREMGDPVRILRFTEVRRPDNSITKQWVVLVAATHASVDVGNSARAQRLWGIQTVINAVIQVPLFTDRAGDIIHVQGGLYNGKFYRVDAFSPDEVTQTTQLGVVEVPAVVVAP